MSTNIRGQFRPVVSTVSTIAAATVSTVLRPAVDVPLGLVIENAPGSPVLHVTFGPTSAVAAYSFSLQPGARFVADSEVIYDGIISGIWAAVGAGAAHVTSLT